MGKSLRQYLAALGKWGWVVAVILVGDIYGIVSSYLSSTGNFVLPIWVWLLILVIILLISPFIAFHKMRLERDELTERARPKLRFGKRVEQILGTVGESFGLEISNQGNNSVDDCRGILIAVEFAVQQGSLSMGRWPVNCPLIMGSSIGGQLSSVLEVVHKEPSTHSSFEYHLAYANNVNGRGLRLPTGQDILIIVGVSSNDTVPLYAICLFHGISTPYPTTFEIIDSNLENCPTIEQCRQMLIAHKAEIEQK